jgi:YD repeat-containing protein
MTRRLQFGVLVLACPGLLIGCATSTSPSGGGNTGGGPACRNYGTVQLVNQFPSSITSAYSSLSGKYDTSQRQASFVLASSFNGPICSTTVVTYGSTSDFVDEISVIPPKVLASSQAISLSDACGGTTTNLVYAYDSQRRLLRVVSSAGDTTTYTAWDTSGRPTLGSFSSGGTVSTAYDSAGRTMTSTQSKGGVTSTIVNTFDVNGILISAVDSGTGQTTTYTVTATEQICK